jgi:ABC transport system ATP-binding/permease protein
MSTFHCPYCGKEHAEKARFCSKCGKPLPSHIPAPMTSACPHCHIPLRANAHFCPNCGFNLLSAQLPRPVETVKVSTNPELVVHGVGGSTQKYLLSKPSARLGRSSDNDIVINSLVVSSHHLQIDNRPNGVAITDLSSTNGTHVNGSRIPPNQSRLLQPGDVIRIGDPTGNSIRITFGSTTGGAIRTQALGKLDLTKLATQVSVLVGRAPSSDLCLPHPSVSQQHAMVISQNGEILLRDLGSTNGTFVNGVRINQSKLQDGDEIKIGPFSLIYDRQQQNLAGSKRLGHRLDGIQLVKQVKGSILILNNVSISVQSSEFVALVGGSGAGKSTLLKALNGFDPATGGQMLIDGEDLYGKLEMYRTEMGYVPQDDIIHRQLPVRLALWYVAKLRLPDASRGEIEASIDDALAAVEMTEHQKKRVSDLSGGQRKRVSIASELLAQPTLFFLDEPTSGLDPGLEKKMMYDLNRLADQGRTVILVTHATTNIEQCDYVAFMAKGGRLAYYGPPKEATTFFNTRDFADIYQKLSQEIEPGQGQPPPAELQIEYQQYLASPAAQAIPIANQAGKPGSASPNKVSAGALWADHYKKSPIYQKYIAGRQANIGSNTPRVLAKPAAPARRPRNSFIRQSWILARRQFDLIRHDFRTLIILLVMLPLIGLLFALVSNNTALVGEFKNSSTEVIQTALKAVANAALKKTGTYMPFPTAQTLLTMLCLALTQGGTFGAAYEIVKERAIFKRERAVNLSVWAYVLSKILVLSLFAIVQVAGVLLLISMRVDFGVQGILFPDAPMIEIFLTLYLAVIASISFGLFLSAILPSTDVVLYVILAQLFVQIILSGTLFPLKSNPASYISPGYWAMSGMGSIVDLPKLAEEGITCQVVEIPSCCKIPGSTATTEISCNKTPAESDSLENYKHTKEYLYKVWGALGAQVVVWLLLTIMIQSRKKTGRD